MKAKMVSGILLLAALLSACDSLLPKGVSGKGKSSSQGQTQKAALPAHEIASQDLVLAYHNELTGQQKYTGKTLLVYGRLSRVEKAQTGAVAILNSGNLQMVPVRCLFPPEQLDALAQVGTGRAAILGVCEGKVEGTVQLADCELVPDIRKYRQVPKQLQDRYNSYKPDLIFTDVDKLVFAIRLSADKVVEVTGVMRRHQPDKPTMFELDKGDRGFSQKVLCQIDDSLTGELQSVKKGWHVRIRGKVRYTTEGFSRTMSIVDCGVIYNPDKKVP
jgi:hypothetical protein